MYFASSGRRQQSSGSVAFTDTNMRIGRVLGRQMPVRASALFVSLGLLTGCQPKPPVPGAETVPKAPDLRVVGYVQVDRYVPLHPAAEHLQALDRQIARLKGRPEPPGLEELEAPAAAALPVPAHPEEPASPSRAPDLERARAAIQEEFAIRAEAEPDQADRRYRVELARLRRRYLEARLDLPEVAQPTDDLTEARARAAEMVKLEHRIRNLEERPERRVLYTNEELRKRRNERDEARQKLEVLRLAELERLRKALELPRRQPMRRVEIPAGELARADRERSEARSQERMRLIREEREALDRLQDRVLPPPPAEPEAVPPEPAVAPSLALAEAAERGTSVQAAPFPGNAAALKALFQQRTSLHEAILRDLRVAANNAARTSGIALKSARAGVPNRTAELLPSVRRILAAQPPPEGVE